MFHGGNGAVSALTKLKDELLGVGIVRHDDCNIHISRESNLRANRNGKSSDERESAAPGTQLPSNGG